MELIIVRSINEIEKKIETKKGLLSSKTLKILIFLKLNTFIEIPYPVINSYQDLILNQNTWEKSLLEVFIVLLLLKRIKNKK